MGKFSVKTAPIRTVERVLGQGAIEIGGYLYPVLLQKRPTTVVIYNVDTAGAGWTEIASGLTDVLAWKLTEKDGNAFDYCYDGVGTTYMRSYGDLQRDTEISKIYARRTGAANITLMLEVWTA